MIPCYNEGLKLPLHQYHSFLEKHSNVVLIFVNDGSSDDTFEILTKIEISFPEKVKLISYAKNKGKAAAVRTGVNYCAKNFSCNYIGYLDADLSASLQECIDLRNFLSNNMQFAFGSRILKIGSVIQRKNTRFLIGRFIATIISNMLNLSVYDTQCGCKLFTSSQAITLFEKPFISKWLFDVELFFRMIQQYGRTNIDRVMVEVPLKRWIDTEQSKVKPGYFFKLWIDLFLIKKTYETNKLEVETIKSGLIK